MDSFVTELLAAASFSDSSSEISFEVYCEEFNLDQKLFIGLLEEGDYDGTVRRAGIGVSICPRTGEIADMINGQGIIGYLVEAPLETWKSMRIALNVEKIGPVYIPKVMVGDEAILHPALHKSDPQMFVAVAGSTSCSNDNLACFEQPTVSVTDRYAVHSR